MSIQIAAQQKLQLCGLLDPPADGIWGIESKNALRSFSKLVGKESGSGNITDELYDLLMKFQVPELQLQDDLPGKIVRAMREKNYWLSRGECRYNIVYLEGVDEMGRANENKPNRWNDLRILLEVLNDTPKIAFKWIATTEPGLEHTNIPLDETGAFRIAFGQYKAWQIGDHNGHPALIQVSPVTGYRDKNKDFKRLGDTVVTGNFGINQHRGNNADVVSLASAGCLVGQTHKGHTEFMNQIQKDPRYLMNHGYRFMTTVIDGKSV